MGVDDPFGDGQAQAAAVDGARARLVDAVEAVEDELALFGGDAAAGVGDAQVTSSASPSSVTSTRPPGTL